jgi:CheY-like chemotaxis protein
MAHALLVEDDVFSSVILQEILMAAGHSVRLVYDGAAALKLIESAQTFDLAVVDVLLPRRLGFEVIEALRRRSKQMGIVAIAGASRADLGLHEAAAKAGADVTLTKPIGRTDLSRHVAELLKRAS